MDNMGFFEWALLFDKITLVEYILIHAVIFAVFGLLLFISKKKDWI